MQSQQVFEERTAREEDYLDLLKRTQADFINYKRRVEREREEQAKYANTELILKLLPIMDDLSRAQESMPEEIARTGWAGGIKLIEKKLATVLEDEGVSKIEAAGQDFDPQEHEALSYEESEEHEEGKVKAVFDNGYRLNGRVIRPARVGVSKGSRKIENIAWVRRGREGGQYGKRSRYKYGI